MDIRPHENMSCNVGDRELSKGVLIGSLPASPLAQQPGLQATMQHDAGTKFV